MAVDYSLYLVTDSTPAILGDKDLPSIVEAAVEGGVTVVQFRQKDGETSDLIRMGKRLHAITKRHRVPLLINDRVDVAQAVGAEGVHLGQDDMGEMAFIPHNHKQVHRSARLLALRFFSLQNMLAIPHLRD